MKTHILLDQLRCTLELIVTLLAMALVAVAIAYMFKGAFGPWLALLF